MAGQKQPLALIEAKGKKHLTKAEKERRAAQEVHAPADNVSPPPYLNAKQKKEFRRIAGQLLELKIMSNLDCDALARFLVARDNYVKFTALVDSIEPELGAVLALDKATTLQDRAFKQCRQAAGDLGLTISSRCKLAVPKAEEKAPESKFSMYMGGARSG